ncbi:4-hydroxy-tetrahydrodipicolinate synthase [Blattabacterium cuenoti]|uniref:4-hydroxy-tetrahydrodipicolinate synthase n=1 Tax=Blattabacterium cuenoti TaxID=1653831 RepID=UPI00163D01B9|nr:4-hydroxy-tetrahydrodipicolinate synthase [Blattabacterium cuenoti]
MEKLYGTGVALITPFKKNGSIDFNGLENLVKFVIRNNVNYLVTLGTTAETSTLRIEEKRDIVECIKSANFKKVPLIIGIGDNNTRNVIEQVINIKNLSDFYAVLSVSPYYNNPSQNGIYKHYKTIVENTNIKLIIYNVPKRTGSNILPETVLRLANDFRKNIIGIKEASGNILQSYRILKNKISNFSVISGDDFLTVPIILGGGDSVISVIAQGFPKQISEMINLAIENKINKSFSIFYKLIDIIDLIYKEGNPTGIKTLLNIIGICNPYVRLPLLIGSCTLEKNMRNYLKKINLHYNH